MCHMRTDLGPAGHEVTGAGRHYRQPQCPKSDPGFHWLGKVQRHLMWASFVGHNALDCELSHRNIGGDMLHFLARSPPEGLPHGIESLAICHVCKKES
jgi:hypothetical protein